VISKSPSLPHTMLEAVLFKRTSRSFFPAKAIGQTNLIVVKIATQQAMWFSARPQVTTKAVTPTHIRIRLFILWAHGKGYGPFSLLPREILHLIFQFHSRPRWLASSFTAEWFELDPDEVTLSNKNSGTKLNLIRFLDLMLDS